MGKTSKPLTLLVHPSMLAWEEIQALQAQGHTIVDAKDSALYDAILLPNAWRMMLELRPYLDLVIKEARKAKYGKTE